MRRGISWKQSRVQLEECASAIEQTVAALAEKKAVRGCNSDNNGDALLQKGGTRQWPGAAGAGKTPISAGKTQLGTG